MVDKTCKKIVEVVKEVLIQVENHSLLVDFFILDVKADQEISLI